MRTAIINPGSREAKALGWEILEPVEAIQTGAFLAQSELDSRRCDIIVPFANGRYRFALNDQAISQLERLPFTRTRVDGTKENIGIGGIYQSIARGRALAMTGAPNWAAISAIDPDAADFSLTYVDQIIMHGLVVGGEGVVDDEKVLIDDHDARRLIRDHFRDRPLIERWTLAFAILGAAMFGRKPD